VLGLEPDPQAARLAASRGIPVLQGGLEQLAGQSESFDVITLSHVIEHFHDPLTSLRACWRLLKPGGHVWIETPNLDSAGHRRFSQHWRGVEAPRHLVLFNAAALSRLLGAAGFEPPRPQRSPSPRQWIYERSSALVQGLSAADPPALNRHLKTQVLLENGRDLIDSSRQEFITVRATKPAAPEKQR
jgi:SAM-dependent methyltransferase